MRSYQRVLVLAPHTDDGELGCGASLAKLLEGGSEVYYVALSAAERSVPAEFPSNVLRDEAMKATKTLGVTRTDVLDFEVRWFTRDRQDILERLIKYRSEFDPDLIFCPSTRDVHQDHQIVSAEAIRAFKNRTVLGYELPWNNLHFHISSFSLVDSHHVSKKVEALRCYASQQHRSYFTDEFIWSWARTRGVQAGTALAEGFEVIRWVW